MVWCITVGLDQRYVFSTFSFVSSLSSTFSAIAHEGQEEGVVSEIRGFQAAILVGLSSNGSALSSSISVRTSDHGS